MIKKLCKEYTSLSDEDIKRIEEIAATLSNVSELVMADIFIDCITKDGDAAIVVAEARPSNNRSLYKCSVVGELALHENEPAVMRTLKVGMTTRDLKAITQENITVKQDVVPIKNDSGKVIGAFIMEKDITDNINKTKQIEMLSETTEQLTQTILSLTNDENIITDYLNDALIVFDANGVVVYRNSAAEDLYKEIGYEDDIIGMSFDNLTLSSHTFDDVIKRQSIFVSESDAGKYILQIKYIVAEDIKDILGLAVRLIVIIKDITEVKQKEKELILKSVAIKEIHHRVKNNLQTIASLLRLQARRTQDNFTKIALNESISRIMSIAVTHEMLAQNGVDDVDIKNVITRIVDGAEYYSTIPNNNINIKVLGDSIIIDSDKATSIGLVVNELIQNSFKHGFFRRDGGNIEVSIQKGRAYSTISVIDDGTGFDINLVEQGSLGLSIVKSIVKDKLHGNINIESSKNGTKVIFDFLC